MKPFKRYLYLSQITLFAGMLISTAMMPDVAIRNAGVSNYGNHLITLTFYASAFLLNSLFIYLAVREVRKIKLRQYYITRALTVLSLFTFIVFISTFPRRFSDIYSNIHDGLGIVLYAYYFLISIWVVLKNPTPTTIFLLLVEACGSLIGLFSAFKVVQLLFIGQLIGAVGFGLLVCLALPEAIKKSQKKAA